MKEIILYTCIYCITTPLSIVLLGSSRLLFAGRPTLAVLLKTLLAPEFILGAILAFLSRLIFVLINNSVSKVPSLVSARTTITVFITLTGTITAVLANHIFLGDRLTIRQIVGFVIILTGVFLATT